MGQWVNGFSPLLALCKANPSVNGGLHTQSESIAGFDVSLMLARPNG